MILGKLSFERSFQITLLEIENDEKKKKIITFQQRLHTRKESRSYLAYISMPPALHHYDSGGTRSALRCVQRLQGSTLTCCVLACYRRLDLEEK